MTTAADALDSIRTGAAGPGDYKPDETVPGGPKWLAQAVRTYAPQMDRMGLPPELRPPFLRDLFALVAAARDAAEPMGRHPSVKNAP